MFATQVVEKLRSQLGDTNDVVINSSRRSNHPVLVIYCCVTNYLSILKLKTAKYYLPQFLRVRNIGTAYMVPSVSKSLMML